MNAQTMRQDIPLIDIGHYDAVGNNDKLKEKIESACRDAGFMYVYGHGIAPEIIARARDVVVTYFEQPLNEKLRDSITRDNYRGYIPAGFFSPNTGSDSSDNYEGYKLHFEVAADDPIVAECDLYGPNKWPDTIPGFRQALMAYWQSCDRVANVLLAILADIMNVDRSEFLQYFETPLTNMTLLHYPPQNAGDDGFGIHPHKDTDALTILAPDSVGGLKVKKRGNGHWIDVNAPGDALVVNIGDLLEIWSGGYFVSTPHKVVNTSGAERYSFPYFVVPGYRTVVTSFRQPQHGTSRLPVNVGDVSREVWRTNWPDATQQDSRFDLGTLEN